MITGRLKEWMEAMKAMQRCQVSLNQSGTNELSGLKTHAHKQTHPHTHIGWGTMCQHTGR